MINFWKKIRLSLSSFLGLEIVTTKTKSLFLFIIIMFFIVTVLFFSFSGNRISKALGTESVGGILIAIDTADIAHKMKSLMPTNGKEKKIIENSNNKNRFYFIIIHFHLKNSQVIGITTAPANLTKNDKDDFITLGQLYQKSPQSAIKLLNDLFNLRIVFYQNLTISNLRNLLNLSGGINLFNSHSPHIPISTYKVLGESLPAFWPHYLANNESMINSFVFENNRVINIALAILTELHEKKNIEYATAFKLLRSQGGSGNLKEEEFFTLIDFFRNTKNLFFQELVLPLKVKEDNQSFFIPYNNIDNPIMQKIFQQYWNQLASLDLSTIYKYENSVVARIKNADIRQRKTAGFEIMNGTNIPRLAKFVRNDLDKAGFKIIQFSNYSIPNGKQENSSKYLEKSVLLVHNMKPLFSSNYQLLISKLGFAPQTVFQTDFSLPNQLTLILGLDASLKSK